MKHRIICFRSATACVILFVAAIAAAEDKKQDIWKAQGRVHDSKGNATDDFEAAAAWSANGDLEGKLAKHGWFQPEKVWNDAGTLFAMNPRGKRSSDGRFVIEILEQPATAVLVYDSRREYGAVGVIYREQAEEEVTLTLQPLVNVHGKVFCPSRKRTPDRVELDIYLTGKGADSFSPLVGTTLNGEFAFKLPPGQYGFDVISAGPDGRMPRLKNSEVAPKTAGATTTKRYGLVVTVPTGGADLDLGVLNIETSEGATGDYAEHYGKPPPELVISDAKGISASIKLADLRGKWIVLEFWAVWCPPCIGRSLPECMKFYDEHAADRDRFEILAICGTQGDDQKTVADYERLVAPIVKDAWKGRELPFPVLIDNDEKTQNAYGIGGIPKLFLIDPEGNLVKDGHFELLAEKLKEKYPSK